MNKYWNRFMIAAVLVALLLLSQGCMQRGDFESEVKPPEVIENPVREDKTTNVPPAEPSGRFLTLPFSDPDIEIVQGYYYDQDRKDHPTHRGIDYIKRNPGNPGEWLKFDV